MTPTLTGNWQASTLNHSSLPNKSQSPTFNTKKKARVGYT
jgi:hypothetical protein